MYTKQYVRYSLFLTSLFPPIMSFMEVSSLFLNIGYVVALVLGSISFTWKVWQMKAKMDTNYIDNKNDVTGIIRRFDEHNESDHIRQRDMENRVRVNADKITELIEIKTILNFIQKDIQEIKSKWST